MTKALAADCQQALADECRRVSSQAVVARRLGYSTAVINQALKGTYTGSVKRLEEKIRGELLHATVDCPVLGELNRNRCIENQGRAFAATNPARVQLYHACQTCPNNLGGGKP